MEESPFNSGPWPPRRGKVARGRNELLQSHPLQCNIAIQITRKVRRMINQGKINQNPRLQEKLHRLQGGLYLLEYPAGMKCTSSCGH